jgi:hypothetical protein
VLVRTGCAAKLTSTATGLPSRSSKRTTASVGLRWPGAPGRQDLALYASFTVRRGKSVHWYPDRKFFLLGRVIGDE